MRLIDADALECDTEWSEYADDYISYSKTEINYAPTIDAEIVVRCEDCKYWIELEHGTGTCKRLENVLFWLGTDATDFCSFAERKDDENY